MGLAHPSPHVSARRKPQGRDESALNDIMSEPPFMSEIRCLADHLLTVRFRGISGILEIVQSCVPIGDFGVVLLWFNDLIRCQFAFCLTFWTHFFLVL